MAPTPGRRSAAPIAGNHVKLHVFVPPQVRDRLRTWAAERGESVSMCAAQMLADALAGADDAAQAAA
jgi:hypothetical protein